MTNMRASLCFLSGALLLGSGIGCSPGDSGSAGPKLQMASLENKAHKFIEPSIASGQNALAAVSLPDDMIVWASDPEGDESYPIVTYTWLLCWKNYGSDHVHRTAALKDVLRYCLTEGQKLSAELGYIPLPPEVAMTVLKAVDSIKP